MARTLTTLRNFYMPALFCNNCLSTNLISFPVLSPILQRQNSWRYASKRSGSSKRPPLIFADIKDADTARTLVLQLNPVGRALVLAEIQKMSDLEGESKPEQQENTQFEHGLLKNLCLYNALPFVGFGFLDNCIMIVAGEYIDITLGAAFTISTMAAAALGNLVSDVAGIGLSGYVEVLVGKIGITVPRLTLAQVSSWQVRWTQTMGRVVGIAVGCLLGMFPLLFYKSHHDHEHEDKEQPKSNENAQK